MGWGGTGDKQSVEQTFEIGGTRMRTCCTPGRYQPPVQPPQTKTETVFTSWPPPPGVITAAVGGFYL